jgi:hypothetical protein
MKKPPMKGKYTEKSDKKMDSYLTQGMSPKERAQFEKMDKAHGKKKKPKTLQEDLKADTKIIKSIKSKEKKHEAKKGKKGEKAEDKREKKEKKK